MRSFLFAASLGLATAFCAPSWAQTAPSGQGLVPGGRPPAQLVMPLVSPEEGMRFLANRAVPPSDAPTPAATAVNAASASATARSVAPAAPVGRPVLGHPLPTDAVSPSGFPRADFAIAPKGQADKPASPLGAGKIQ